MSRKSVREDGTTSVLLRMDSKLTKSLQILYNLDKRHVGDGGLSFNSWVSSILYNYTLGRDEEVMRVLLLLVEKSKE